MGKPQTTAQVKIARANNTFNLLQTTCQSVRFGRDAPNMQQDSVLPQSLRIPKRPSPHLLQMDLPKKHVSAILKSLFLTLSLLLLFLSYLRSSVWLYLRTLISGEINPNNRSTSSDEQISVQFSTAFFATSQRDLLARREGEKLCNL